MTPDYINLFKSEAYCPADERKQVYGSVTVQLLNEQPSSIPDVIKRELKVHITAKVRQVTTL